MRPNDPAISCFLVTLKRGAGFPVSGVIPFQTIPQSIVDSKVAVYQDTPIIGRSSPLKSYQFSGPRTLSFTMDFHAQSPESNLDILMRVRSIQALVSPAYRAFKIEPPTRCLIIIGLQIAMLGVCKSVSVNVSGDEPWNIAPGVLAHHAAVSVVFEECLNIPLSSLEVQLGLPISLAGNEFTGSFPTAPAGSVGVSTSTTTSLAGNLTSFTAV